MDDQAAKWFAGQMGVCAVLMNVLIDKGLVSPQELRDRFQQAHDAAAQSSGGLDSAAALAAMLEYLGPDDAQLN
jgi:hypothetical protein